MSEYRGVSYAHAHVTVLVSHGSLITLVLESKVIREKVTSLAALTQTVREERMS